MQPDQKTFEMNRPLIACLSALVLLGGASASFAQSAPAHPREAEVNARLDNQANRVDHAVAQGRMSGQKAARIQRQDQRIANEEGRMEARHGGRITKPEQAKLNRQENAVSREIAR